MLDCRNECMHACMHACMHGWRGMHFATREIVLSRKVAIAPQTSPADSLALDPMDIDLAVYKRGGEKQGFGLVGYLAD